MRATQIRILAFALVVLALVMFAACSPSDEGGGTGTGGTSSSTAGTTGSGGTNSTAGRGGTTGAAGAAGSSSTAGTTGAAGSIAGTSGGSTAGTGGTSAAGTGGGAGTTGGAGAGGGAAGASGGRGGAAGAGGAVGAGGRGGRGGTSATAGSGGGGTGGGAAGSSGTAGTTGSGGSGNVTCPSPALKAGDTNKTIQVGSDSRTYILHVPSKYTGTAAVPLVVDFHPLGGSGSSESGSSPYKALTDAEGVISAYPNGKSGPSGGAWNVGPCCVANVDDVAFAKALVADVEKVACIDTKRVYAVGFSMGGGMSHYVACHAADIFAAVAPASFDLPQENVGDCKPSRPIAQVSFRSSNDTLVPYAGGASSVVAGMPVTFLGAKATMDKWAQLNSCTGSPTATDSNNCQYYTSCAGGVQVGLCTMTSGHAPGKADVGWPFLKKFTLP